MPVRLIVNADDFGLTCGINRAVAELHQAGVLTSATLMATGPAFLDAVAVAKFLPSLGLGCHVVLVDGTPVSPPAEIPTLVASGSQSFRTTLAAFVRDLLLGRIDEADIAQEAAAQVAILRRAGIPVTHVDTHKHLHLFPTVTRALLRYRIAPALRNPFEPAFTRTLSGGAWSRKLQLTFLQHLQPRFQRLAHGTLTTNGTLGIAATGSLHARTLHQLLAALPAEGTYELCCHPGYYDLDLQGVSTRLRHHRDVERQALLTEIPEMLTRLDAPELIHYGNLKQDGEA